MIATLRENNAVRQFSLGPDAAQCVYGIGVTALDELADSRVPDKDRDAVEKFIRGIDVNSDGVDGRLSRGKEINRHE